MSRDVSLQQLSKELGDNVERVQRVRQEVEEIQVGFNSAYVEWKARHDATLEQLVESVTARLEEVGPDLRRRVDVRAEEERSAIAERRQQLRDQLIPDARAQADRTLAQAQQLRDEAWHQLNPRLDRREEELKARRAAQQEELTRLNQQIRALSGCLGVVFHFIRINRLSHQRQQVIGQLKALQQDLKDVREEWQEAEAQARSQQQELQSQWQSLTLQVAQLQAELDLLDDDGDRERLTLQRAARVVIDNLKESVAGAPDDLQRELDEMVLLNVQTDEYQEGLGSVGSFMSLLDGISEGLRRFDESVQGLLEEQRMHSSYLPQLRITLPDQVLAFHAQWDGLRRKVQDDRRLSGHPNEFVAAIQPVMEGDLSEANIRAMFEGLGEALKRATDQWRGQ